ncbi:tolB protein precursor [Labilithrix luteola]|uniref:TolB protein n=1 Tax=Labilithrix luteola TaxID=1391654 RepID=A0A0K1PQE7_9BACT|nr:PD40 domain-containing protein [Labilithrix luteola]AKU95339.1 tolB protein precursor [Labilithrix luteola]
MQYMIRICTVLAPVVLVASCDAPGESAAPGETSAPSESGASADSHKPGKSGNSGKPGNSGGPGDSGAPGDAGAPSDSGVPGDAGAPSDSGTPGDSGAPDDSGAPPIAAPGGTKVPVNLSGSIQNPCWSPDGKRLVFTRFASGYNEGNPDVGIVPVTGGNPTIVSNANGGVNLPGACWNRGADVIAYSGGDDELYVIPAAGGKPRQVTSRRGFMSWEPSLSPDGTWIVFESHARSTGGRDAGTIWKIRVDGTGLTQLTSAPKGPEGDREPNWSPAGDKIVFQSDRTGVANIWTMSVDGSDLRNVTNTRVEATDASWSPDGRYIVYSGGDGRQSNVLIIAATGGPSVYVRHYSGYDGAPSWSPDGKTIAFETSTGSPDGSAGTTLTIAPVPTLP